MRLSSILIVVVVVGVVVGAFFRPAVVLGTTTDAISGSLARQLPDSNLGGGDKLDPVCQETAQDNFTCQARYLDGSNVTESSYGVALGRYGCWDATPLQAGNGEPLSGCIWIADY